MTCIIGLRAEGRLWIAGDSYSCAEHRASILNAPKVVRRGAYLLGVAGSARVANLVECSIRLPTPDEGCDPYAFAVRKLVPALRDALQTGGCVRPDNEARVAESTDSEILIGFSGTFIVISTDFAVLHARRPHGIAIGSGAGHAEGALYVAKDRSAKERLKLALEAAETHTAYVHRPWTIRSQPI